LNFRLQRRPQTYIDRIRERMEDRLADRCAHSEREMASDTAARGRTGASFECHSVGRTHRGRSREAAR
jgi:hypothetical protein